MKTLNKYNILWAGTCLPNIEIDLTSWMKGRKRVKRGRGQSLQIFHRYIWSCFSWSSICRNQQRPMMSCSVLGSLHRRAAAGVTLLCPVVALRAGEEGLLSFKLSRKKQTTFYRCPSAIVYDSMVLGEPWGRSAEGTSTSVPRCHPALLLSLCWAVRTPCRGRNWDDSHTWQRLSKDKSSGLLVVSELFFVLLLALMITHGLNGAGFVPLDEAQDTSYSRLENKSVLRSGLLLLRHRLSSWSYSECRVWWMEQRRSAETMTAADFSTIFSTQQTAWTLSAGDWISAADRSRGRWPWKEVCK